MIRVCSTLRHKAFRVSAASHPVPSQSAWMFHCTLCLLYAYGFLGEDTAVDVGGTRL
ncbi:hypothetical protein C8F01DRAFT_1368258, partial [Mycena amicta]